MPETSGCSGGLGVFVGYQPIEDYGIIGDLHTVALVGKNGSIDFLSFPKFDSPTIFCALLDDERGGRFSIRPRLDDDLTRKQMYLPDTNVLITRFLASAGVGEISDFMPVGIYPHDHPRQLVRRVKTVRGTLRYDLTFEPRFDYARAEHEVEVRDGEVLFSSSGADGTTIRLRTQVPVTITGDGAAIATFDLRGWSRRLRSCSRRPSRGCPARPRHPTTSPASSRTPSTSGAPGSVDLATPAGGARW